MGRIPAYASGLTIIACVLIAGCTLQPTDSPKLPTYTPTPTATPTPEPTPDPCARMRYEGTPGCHESTAGVGSEMDKLIHAAIDAACTAHTKRTGQPVDCDRMSGPPRPGEWQTFVSDIAASLREQGACASYDYDSGEGGRASELGVRWPTGTRVFYFQVETAAGRIRRPPGAYRSYCDGIEAQPIREVRP